MEKKVRFYEKMLADSLAALQREGYNTIYFFYPNGEDVIEDLDEVQAIRLERGVEIELPESPTTFSDR